MGLGPIPYSSIDIYATRYGIESIDEFDRFKSLIRRVDAEYIKLRTPKSEDEPDEVNAQDTDAVRGLFGRLKARADAVHGNRLTEEE